MQLNTKKGIQHNVTTKEGSPCSQPQASCLPGLLSTCTRNSENTKPASEKEGCLWINILRIIVEHTIEFRTVFIYLLSVDRLLDAVLKRLLIELYNKYSKAVCSTP